MLIQQMPSLTVCTMVSCIACERKLWAKRTIKAFPPAEVDVATVVVEVDPPEEDTVAAVEADVNFYIPTAGLTCPGVF